jgi:predicted nicotinamide N-methyase
MTEAARFVRENTAVAAPPLTPEIRLHLAGEVVPLWRKIEETLGVEGVPPPYWAFAWPGGQALARYILDHPERLRGKMVLDFGAGSGLLAVAAARAEATVTAAEIDAFAAAAISLNAELNGVAVTVTCEDVIGRSGWDVILAGDMCYERPLAMRLMAWLKTERQGGAEILLGDPGRNYFFDTGMEKLASYSVPTSLDLEDREIRETGVYRLL